MGQQDLKVRVSGQFAPRVLRRGCLSITLQSDDIATSDCATSPPPPSRFRLWAPRQCYLSPSTGSLLVSFKLKKKEENDSKTFSEARGQRSWKKVNSTQPPTSNKIMILYVDFVLYWFHWSSQIKAGSADPDRKRANFKSTMDHYGKFFRLIFSFLSFVSSPFRFVICTDAANCFLLCRYRAIIHFPLESMFSTRRKKKNVLHSRWQSEKKSRKAFREEDHFASVTYTLIRSAPRTTPSILCSLQMARKTLMGLSSGRGVAHETPSLVFM